MKGKSKSKSSFKKGDQCIQNPNTRKYRDEVKKSVISNGRSAGGLTHAAIQKHNEDIDDDLNMEDLAISETTGVTKKSKAFSISGLTDCTNLTFNNVLNKWNSSDKLDQEKCAILAAVTEVIRSKGGSESESDYFSALMTLLESSTEQDSCAAILYLLSLVVKKVSTAILKSKCSECLKRFGDLLNTYHGNGRASLLMTLVECLSTVLNAQDAAVWSESSTQHSFLMLLTCTIHSKPKVRKVAQGCVQSTLKLKLLNHKDHPAGAAATKFMTQHLKQYTNDSSSACYNILNLMKNCLHHFKESYLKELCEAVLQLLAVNHPVLKTKTMETLHSMFVSNPLEENLSVDLNEKLIAALYDFQPSFNDVNVAEPWLSVVLEAHSNLSLLENSTCLKYLPRFFGTAMNFFMSDYREVVQAAANIMRQASEKCMEPYLETLEEDISSKDSAFVKIFSLIENGLHYKFQPVWDVVLKSLQYLFTTYGKHFSSVMLDCVCSLIDLHSSPDFPFRTQLDKAIGTAFSTIGPKLILAERPLELVNDSTDCQFPRAWLLPIMKDNIRETELQYFIDEMLPMAAHLREKGMKCRANNQDLEAKVYETLQFQVWSLLTGFCTKPTDFVSFKNIAKILGTALMEESNLRVLVIQALRSLINSTPIEHMNTVSQFSKNYMPILFNLFTSDDTSCKQISMNVLEAIKAFLIITDNALIGLFIDKSIQKFSEEKANFKRYLLMDLLVCMVRYSNADQIQKFYNLVMQYMKSTDKKLQKKAYRIMEEIFDGNSETCKNLIQVKFEEIKNMFIESLKFTASSSKAPRMRCFSYLIKHLSSDQRNYLETIIPEVILCTKEVGIKAKSSAFDLIKDIGTALIFLSEKPKEECVEEYFNMVMAGLAGSPHMISATFLAFTKMVFEYRDCLGDKLIGSLVEAAILLLKSKTNEIVKSSLVFLKAIIKILDANELSGHLEPLVKNLFSWRSNNSNNKSSNRQRVRVILERLDKKCGYKLIRSLVPEAHKRFIIQIHKQLQREKKRKEAARIDRDEEDDDDKQAKTEQTWDDILADSDEEEDGTTKHQKNAKNSKKRSGKEQAKTWIMDDTETLDLMDPKIAKNIVGTRPKLQGKRKVRAEDNFTLSADGKLVIPDENKLDKEDNENNKLDIGEKDMLSGFDKTPKQLKLGKRKHLEDMPGEEDQSVYQPGGKGIHRSQVDDVEEPSRKKKFGEEYKSKKSGGDVKLKGKPDPYAYIPLDRQKLNKRKRAKLTGQFNSMVKATKRGASKANKSHKKHKK